MVYAKTKLFEKELQECAGYFKALAHPARLHILKHLAGTKACITGDISGELPLSRTTVNQHLSELKKAGLIKGQVEGVKTKFCLDSENVRKMAGLAEAFLSQIHDAGATAGCDV